MTALVWDEVGARRFEAGVERGVLFVHGDPIVAVPWNGLSTVVETLQGEIKNYYTDGIRYLSHSVLGAYSATLQAYTYPDELDEHVGVKSFEQGVFLHDQNFKPFSLAYRTGIGDDVEGVDAGYKLHIVYNVMAMPSNRSYNSLARSVNLAPFEWTLNAVPPQALGIRPTSHISLDSTKVDPALLSTIEDTLYGTALVDPDLPDLIDILQTIEDFYS